MERSLPFRFRSVIHPTLQQRFLSLIQGHTGLKLRARDWSTIAEGIIHRTEALGLSSPEDYYQQICSATRFSSEREHQQEWQTFVDLITIGESYFFRDRGQIHVLREHILPRLIEQRRSHLQPSLKLWSAGCSTGEEPYSLALLLQSLIPDLDRWTIQILGTDLNPIAIKKAQRGIYRNWSFRQTDANLRRQSFQAVDEDWQINPNIRRRVTFRCGNLLKDAFPNASIHTMDLILCRNVFIYFDASTIAKILKKFHATLSPQGYLMTGHTELHEQDLQAFQVLSFPDSVVYQPRTQPEPEIIPSPIQQSQSLTVASPVETLKTDQTLASVKARTRVKGAHKLSPSRSESGMNSKAQYLLAQRHWQQGEYEQALSYCQKILQAEPDELFALELNADIAQSQGDRKQAKLLLKKMIYLSPRSTSAYIKLGKLYQAEGQPLRAQKSYQTAWDLLRGVDPDCRVQDDRTAGQLRAQLKALLS